RPPPLQRRRPSAPATPRPPNTQSVVSWSGLSWLEVEGRAFLDGGLDLLSPQQQLAEVGARHAFDLIAVVRRARLARIAVAHQTIGPHRRGELDHRHPRLAVDGRANPVFV